MLVYQRVICVVNLFFATPREDAQKMLKSVLLDATWMMLFPKKNEPRFPGSFSASLRRVSGSKLFRACPFHRCETHGDRVGNLSSCNWAASAADPANLPSGK